MRRLFFAAAALAAVVVGPARAATIDLFNTGVDATGAVQANGAAEIHYALVGGPDGPTDARVATAAGGYPIGPFWSGDDSSSAWIGPVGFSDLTGPEGDYDYRTTFSLDGLDASTASITGGWQTDDNGIDILINGVSTGSVSTNFSSFSTFAITSGFTSGLNTLDFILHNASGPIGLRVEMSGTADLAPTGGPVGGVPEPATWALMISGFSLAGAALRRRRTMAAA